MSISLLVVKEKLLSSDKKKKPKLGESAMKVSLTINNKMLVFSFKEADLCVHLSKLRI